jgi:hypothetical protein
VHAIKWQQLVSMTSQPTKRTAFSCLQELLTELQDQDQFGKRGEAWTFAQVAAIVLVLLPPFQLVVSSNVSSIWPIGNLTLHALCSCNNWCSKSILVGCVHRWRHVLWATSCGHEAAVVIVWFSAAGAEFQCLVSSADQLSVIMQGLVDILATLLITSGVVFM